jgi:hypothetical protein
LKENGTNLLIAEMKMKLLEDCGLRKPQPEESLRK